MTRSFMLKEFELSGWSFSTPAHRSLSPLGRDAFPVFLYAAIHGADEASLVDAMSYPPYWNAASQPETESGSRPPLLNALAASFRLGIHEFNAWYVRGLAERLRSEGAATCEVTLAPAASCRKGSCALSAGEILPLDHLHGRRSWLAGSGTPTVAIPSSEGCYHSIRRVRR